MPVLPLFSGELHGHYGQTALTTHQPQLHLHQSRFPQYMLVTNDDTTPPLPTGRLHVQK